MPESEADQSRSIVLPRVSPAEFGWTARAQMVGVFLLGAALVAVPLYLWRRPRGLADPSVPEGAEVAAVAPSASAPSTTAKPGEKPSRVTLSGFRYACSDGASARFLQASCDKLPAIEERLTTLLTQNASCVPVGESGAVDFSFVVELRKKRQAITPSLLKDGRTLKLKTASGCLDNIKHAVREFQFEGAHEHLRYRVDVLASFSPDAP